ncbi:UDP-glucose 4-epimerase family protein [Psychromonas antarctica]|uniref:UDP-glucose 4-epimerase family protein n=1 Tax=Psychromonas antarctica TaxID=67573 RepID=UPI001EE8297F|nr:SDR family oxidoreductase [Psychromonas antarctica]MCG6202521.1 SDR family oxidoreductase [Psychromonas antarctica]
MKILLTGSTGFMGKVLVQSLDKDRIELILAGRDGEKKSDCHYIYINSFDSDSQFDLRSHKCDVAIHCAARVHVMNDSSANPLEEFREVNTYGTLNLAQQAADAGVKRFIFISSIKVNGESTELGVPFKPDDTFMPTDPYGLSKYEAEVGLRRIATDTGMEVVIIRPPLVYGPGVKANFASMMKWVNKGLPLPLGGIKDNKRSLVSVDNLVDLITTCIDHPNAANQTFLVSDDEDVSTSQLLSNMAIALEAPNRLLPVPSSWFTFAARLIGKPAISQRLCGSLQVDISKTKELLNWTPPYSAAECMKKTADAFLK